MSTVQSNGRMNSRKKASNNHCIHAQKWLRWLRHSTENVTRNTRTIHSCSSISVWQTFKLWLLRWRMKRVIVLLMIIVIFTIIFVQQIEIDFLNGSSLFAWGGYGSEAYSVYYTLLRESGNDTRCVFPRIDPWDASIQKYLSVVEPVTCKRLQQELTYFARDEPKIFFDKQELSAAGYSNVDDILCQLRCFDKQYGSDFINDYGKWTELENGTATYCEFVEVRCYSSRLSPLPFYVNAHAQIVPIQAKIRRSENSDSISKKKSKKKVVKNQPNVLLFVVDSVSHSNWLRSLPKTLRVLRDELNATIFDGFSKVGDNSFPNAIAFLAGKRVYAKDYEPEVQEDMSKDFFDEWPLIWHDFKAHNYATYYAEDFIQFNLFSYLSNGFRQKPTDHYFRPYWLNAETSLLYRRSTTFCYGNNARHKLQLDYLSRFIEKYSNASKHQRPSFALNWLSELSHNWMNQVAAGDEDFASFFHKLMPQLEDSFVFVFADHGHRFDKIRRSLVGRIEERMPFFSLHAPRWLHEQVPLLSTILQHNSQQLATFYDLFVTLKDILYLSENDAWHELNLQKSHLQTQLSNAEKAQKMFAAQPVKRFRTFAPRGLSLLRALPTTRNCVSAGIPQEFCVCQRERDVNTSDTLVRAAAEHLVSHVNALIAKDGGETAARQCAKLELASVENAQIFIPNDAMLISARYGGTPTSDFILHYRVTVSVAPSGADLEATVRSRVPNGGFTVIGDVNRINAYGNQSVCVHSSILRKYCFCI